MKKNNRILSILLAVELVFCSLPSIAFAEDNRTVEQPAVVEQQALQENSIDAGEQNLGISSGEKESLLSAYPETQTSTYYPTPSYPVSNNLFADAEVAAYPDYKSVSVYWRPVMNPSTGTPVVAYEVWRATSQEAAAANEFDKIADVTYTEDKADISYRDTKATTLYRDYYYKVKALSDSGSTTVLGESDVVSAQRTRTVTYKLTFGETVKLTSHDSSKKKRTFKKGQVVKATGFCQGAYIFPYDGHSYHVKWFRIKNPKGSISKNKYNVTRYDEECDADAYLIAENYINHSKYKSKTKYIIWASLYSQRVFVLEGKKNTAGGWKVIKSWQCGSGKAVTPTPSGINKVLWDKFKKYSKHKWWNCFSGMNAIHGSNSGDAALGKLISNGCIRVTNAQAEWVYDNIPINTRVVVY